VKHVNKNHFTEWSWRNLMSKSRIQSVVVLLFAAVLFTAGCGGSPTAGQSGTAKGTSAVIDEINALPASEQRAKAIDLAKKESGELTLYTSLTSSIADAIGAEFTKRYGIKLKLYQGNSETVLQKVLQEVSAGHDGADIVDSNFAEMGALQDQHLLAEYRGPSLEAFPKKSQFGSWYAERYNILLPTWNTNLTKPGDEPKSWEDLADLRFKGKVALEIGDADWFANVTKYWLDHGKSQTEVDTLWNQIASNAKAGKGHTTVMELLSAGQFGVMSCQYTYITDLAMEKGAPLNYRGPDGKSSIPAFARPNGIGMLATTANPASAWLFTDWILDNEGQQAVANAGLTPAMEVPGDDSYAGLSIADYDVKGLSDVKTMKSWDDKYDQLLRTVGSAS
jgi:iron(III) transport system substrate-binding protein